jgi:hypothetical protein
MFNRLTVYKDIEYKLEWGGSAFPSRGCENYLYFPYQYLIDKIISSRAPPRPNNIENRPVSTLFLDDLPKLFFRDRAVGLSHGLDPLEDPLYELFVLSKAFFI